MICHGSCQAEANWSSFPALKCCFCSDLDEFIVWMMAALCMRKQPSRFSHFLSEMCSHVGRAIAETAAEKPQEQLECETTQVLSEQRRFYLHDF